MCKLSGSNYTQLLSNNTVPLQSQLDTEKAYVGFDVSQVTMRTNQLEQAC